MKLLRKAYNPNAKTPEKLQKRKTALLWNYDNLWSLNRQPKTSQWHTLSFFQKYLETTKSFGAPTDIIYEDDDLNTYKVVIAPAFELVDSDLINKWIAYVKQGGHLVLTLRTGVKNKNGHLFAGEWGAPIYPLIDAYIEGFDQLLPNGKGTIEYKNKDYYWNNWADLISPNNPENTLAKYTDQFYAGKAAVVTNKIGKGTVTYIGVDTDDAQLEKDILKEVYKNVQIAIDDYPEGIYVNWRDGFWVAVNYSSKGYELKIPAHAHLLIGSRILSSGGVTVWKE